MHSRFSEKWLETTCSLLPGVHSAVFMVPDPNNDQLHLLAHSPEDLAQHQDFFAIVKYALKKTAKYVLPRRMSSTASRSIILPNRCISVRA